jgi:hypothetical protein
MNLPDQHPSTASPASAHRAAERTAAEDVPETWDEVRDPAFFALTARTFPAATTLAMTVLLASYDPEPAPRTVMPTGD